MSFVNGTDDAPIAVKMMAGGGSVAQAIPDLEDPAAIAAEWGNFAQVNWAGGDFVTSVAGVNGQAITVLSASPLSTGESAVVNVAKAVMQPCALEFAGSYVRTAASFATAALFANDPVSGPDTVPAPIDIVSYYQSSAVQGATNTGTAGTVMHMTLASPLPSVGSNQAVFIGDWINIAGLADSRLNYPNACINYISPNRLTIAVGFRDEAALPSLNVPTGAGNSTTVSPAGSAKVYFYNNMSGARNGFGLRFTGLTATSAAVISIFGGDDNQVSGTLLGDHRASIATSAPTYVSGQNWGQYEIRASSRYLLECGPAASVLMDKAEQTQTTWLLRDIPRTSVKPASGSALYPRFRLYKPISMTRPVAKIVSAVHAAASTATVVTMDVAPSAAGLVVGNWVTLRGVRDQTNFANSGTAVQITAINEGAKQFTIAWGSTAIATGYGGSVILVNGGIDQPGIITGAIQSVVSRVAEGGNWLDVVGSTTWSGVSLGDYVDLHGVRDAVSGADLGLDGAWEVAHLATTTATLRPVFNIAGARVSPALGTLTSTNCGGSVILRPTLRAHDLSVRSWAEVQVTIDGQGTTRSDKALPVVGVGGTISSNQGTAASVGTSGTGSWPVRAGNAGIADVASAAITTTATSSSITNDLGNGFQVTFPVTAVSGTSPTLDIRIEESFDGGTNWVTMYEMQRITAIGSYNTPILRASGRNIRYVRTIAGTSPSFTMAITRNVMPFIQAEPQKRLIDRSIVLTTANSVTPTLFAGAANNVQLVINIGAATTPPALQIEGSEDGTNWYAVGSPLAAVASSTVQLTLVDMSATFVRARVSTVGATVTAGYVSLKAWS